MFYGIIQSVEIGVPSFLRKKFPKKTEEIIIFKGDTDND